MKMHDIFFGSDAKFRSGWRFFIFVAAYLFISIFVYPLTTAAIIEFGISGSEIYLLNSLASLIPALLIGWLCGRILEGLPFRALGASPTAGWSPHFLLGSLTGALTLAFAAGTAAMFGELDFSFNNVALANIARSMFTSLLVFGAAAAFEEVLFRGYILQTFARSGLGWLAIILTALFFGAVHYPNPNSTLLSTANTGLAGIWFGVAYLKTRDLWFVWGLHLFWNWMQGSVFGIEVSGLTEIVGASFLRESDRGPDWLTGGNYGIEASVACTAALAISTIAIYFVPLLKPSEEMMKLQKPARN